MLFGAARADAYTTDTRRPTESSPARNASGDAQVDPSSGAARYSYAFEVPPGTGGLTPRLSLEYSSQTRHSEYGYGWNLSVGHLERSTRFGRPAYNDPAAVSAAQAGDLFELDGQLLVRDGLSSDFFLRRADGSRITYRASSPSTSYTNYWEVSKPDGTRYLYGTSAQSRLHRNADSRAETFRWCLAEVVDPQGNSYRIHYEADEEEADTIPYKVFLYPRRIEYSFHASAPASQTRRLVELLWEARGDGPENYDWPTSYRSGFKLQRKKRLSQVVVGIDLNANAAIELNSSEQVRRYELQYYPKTDVDDPGTPEDETRYAPFSQLESIQRWGAGPGESAFPSATTFEYSRPARSFTAEAPVAWPSSATFPTVQRAHEGYWSDARIELADMNGDGLLDYVRVAADSVWKVALGTPWGFEPETTWLWQCAPGGGLGAACPEAYANLLSEQEQDYYGLRTLTDLVDIDGDQRADRVVARDAEGDVSDTWTVFRNLGTHFGPPQSWGLTDDSSATMPYHAGIRRMTYDLLTYSPSGAESMLADMNGDGRTDYLAKCLAYMNSGSGFSAALSLQSPEPDFFPRCFWITTWQYRAALPFATNSTVLGLMDVNADGLPDRVLDVCLTNPGTIFFNVNGRVQGSETSGHDKVEVRDCEHGEAQGSTNWSELRDNTYSGAPPFSTLKTLVDLNGDGVLDYVVAPTLQSPVVQDRVTVYLGLGDGRFLATQGPAVGGDPGGLPWAIAPVGDFSWPPTTFRLGDYAGYEGEVVQGSIRDLLDVNGDGLADQVFADRSGVCAGSVACPNANWQVWLHPGPEGLLEHVTTELGAEVTIEYAPSNQSALAASAHFAQSDDEDLPDSVRQEPGSHWVVTDLRWSDGRSGTVEQSQHFEYAGFRFDDASREPVGARMVEATDAAGVVRRSLFHQHPQLRGGLASSELCDGASCYERTETTWTALEPTPGASYARPTRTLRRRCEPGTESCDETATSSQLHGVERSFDALTGNLLQETDWGEDASLVSEADNKVRVVSYAENITDDEWLTSYVEEESVWIGSVGSGELASRVRVHYDVEAFTAGASTTPVPCLASQTSCGARRRFVETLRSGAPDPEVWAVERYDYDAFGNPVAFYDARAVAAGSAAATRQTEYDGVYHTFPVRVTNALGESRWQRSDPGTGSVTRRLSAGGHLRCSSFDSFGRLQEELDHGVAVQPGAIDGTACNTPLATYSYLDTGDPEHQRILTTEWAGSVPARDRHTLEYRDGLGRVYQNETEHRSTATTGEFDVVTRSWDARGDLACETFAFRRNGGPAGSSPAVCSAQKPHWLIHRDSLRRPYRRQLVTPSEARDEVTEEYAVNDFGTGADDPPGDQLVTIRTIRGGADSPGDTPTPDRVVFLGANNRGEVVAVREGPAMTLLLRDPLGRVTRVDGPDVDLAAGGSDPNWLDIHYNAVGQRTQINQPTAAGAAGPTWSYDYDLNGNLETVISPRDVAIRTHRDALGRTVLEDYEPFTTNAASPGPNDLVYQYFTSGVGIGRLAAVGPAAADGVQTYYEYDLRGRLASQTRDFGDSLQFSFGYAYDRMGRPVSVFLPDGSALGTVYDANSTNAVFSLQSSSSWGSTAWVGYPETHPSGGLEQLDIVSTLPGSVPIRLDYRYRDSDQRLAGVISTKQGTTPSTLQDLSYRYDVAGNLRGIDDALGELSQQFGYDDLHRIVLAEGTGPSGYGTNRYAYDAAGNLLEKGPGTDAAPQTGRVRMAYGRGPGQPVTLAGVEAWDGSQWQGAGSYLYDEEGGAIQRNLFGSSLAMARDDHGRLVWASTPTAIANIFFYDHTGQRSEKLQTQFNGSGGEAVLAHRLYVDPSYEVDVKNGTHSVHVFAGSRRLATLERSGLGLAPGAMSEQVRNFHPDHVGSNTLVTDHRGEPVQKMTSEPFGGQRTIAATASPGSRYLFTDQEYDPETGLDEFGARYYDSQVGRFLSPDPALIGPDVGVTFSALASSSQAGNAFAYVENRPTRFVDPTGEGVYSYSYSYSYTFTNWAALATTGVVTTTYVAYSGAITVEGGGAAIFVAGGEAMIPPAAAATALVGLGYLAYQIWQNYQEGLSQPAQMSSPTDTAGEESGEEASGQEDGKENTADQDAAIQLAKEAKRKGGLTKAEADALADQARAAGVKPVHDHTSPEDAAHHTGGPHIRIGPINHILVRP